MKEPILEFKNLVTEFRTEGTSVKAVNNISFTLNKGETIGIVGESGSGKTLTGLSIANLLDKSSFKINNGEILFNNRDLILESEESLRKIRGNKITYFKEKSSVDVGWINGGFMVMNSNFFNYIKNDRTFLEKEPLEKLVKIKQLSAFRFNGFWQCIDTKRDKDRLEKLLKSKKF